VTQAHSNHVPLHWESLNFDCEAWCTPSRSRLGHRGKHRPPMGPGQQSISQLVIICSSFGGDRPGSGFTTHSAPPQPPGYDAHDPLLSLPPPHPTPSPAACSSLSSTTVTLCATSFLLVHWCGSAAVVGDHGDVQVFPTRHPIPSPTPPHSPHIPRPPSLPTTLPNRRTTVFTAVLCGLGWARWTGRHGAGCLGSVR
jgi:hypothetical protein